MGAHTRVGPNAIIGVEAFVGYCAIVGADARVDSHTRIRSVVGLRHRVCESGVRDNSMLYSVGRHCLTYHEWQNQYKGIATRAKYSEAEARAALAAIEYLRATGEGRT